MVQSAVCGAIAVDGAVPCHLVMVAVVALGTNLRLERAAGQAGSPTAWVIRVRQTLTSQNPAVEHLSSGMMSFVHLPPVPHVLL